MIVVHPKDPSTRFLSLIYEELDDVLFFDSIEQKEQMLYAIENAPKEEMVLLLGHGTPNGLLCGLITDDDASILKDRPNLIGIWCYASTYALRHRLKGFFCGMFISEWTEAVDNNIEASLDEIEDAAWDFAGRFGELLREGYTMDDIVKELMNPCFRVNPLTVFNYSRLTYREQGNEPLPVEEDYWGFE